MWASLVGRLDPETGTITEYPTEAEDPHTPAFHPNGKLYFTAQRAGMLGRLDPETFQSWAIPSGVGIIRRMWVTESGDLLIHQSSTNRVGLVKILDGAPAPGR